MPERPQKQCEWEDEDGERCQEEFTLFPDNLGRSYCDEHQLEAMKEAAEELNDDNPY